MKGIGVERDEAEAIRWYTEAAAKGITASQVQLGKLLYKAAGDEPLDRTRGTELLRKAADAGDLEAKTSLAMLLLQAEPDGLGFADARELLVQAADAGHSGAALHLGHLCSGRYSAARSPIPPKPSPGTSRRRRQAIRKRNIRWA